VSKEPSLVPKTTLQGKAGHLITAMDDWEQLHTNATLLKPPKHSGWQACWQVDEIRIIYRTKSFNNI